MTHSTAARSGVHFKQITAAQFSQEHEALDDFGYRDYIGASRMNNAYTSQYEHSAALIIGINDYTHAPPLSFARCDAESVAELLKARFGFSNDQVVILLDAEATRQGIMERFLAYEGLAENARLLVFFAVMGLPSQAIAVPSVISSQWREILKTKVH